MTGSGAELDYLVRRPTPHKDGYTAQQAYLGWSNADSSAFELPASYCAEAFLSIK